MKQDDFWNIQDPIKWAEPPNFLSYSSYKQITSCPRRWILENSDYSNLWNGRGYPRPLVEPAILGEIIHKLVETLTKSFVSAGCISVDDPKTTTIIKGMGGFSNIIGEIIESSIEKLIANPRTNPYCKSLKNRLITKQGQMRRRGQQLLRDVKFIGKSNSKESGSNTLRKGLYGTFTELWLNAKKVSWAGKADIINISKDSVEIIDYKTGAEHEDHTDQVRLYATLWYLDSDRNPMSRLVDRIVIKYPGKTVDVPVPDKGALVKITEELKAKRQETISLIGSSANPIVKYENCKHCSVRHMCFAFWSQEQHEEMFSNDQKKSIDIELRITKRNGPTSWEGNSIVCSLLAPGSKLLLRVAENQEFSIGDTLRVLGGRLVQEADQSIKNGGLAFLGAGSRTEIFVVGYTG